MIKLQKDFAAFSVHGVSDVFPADDLAVVEQAWCAEIAVAVWCGNCCFTDQESAFGSALSVVLGHQGARASAIFGTHPGQRRQYNAVGEGEPPDFNWGMKFGHGCLD